MFQFQHRQLKQRNILKKQIEKDKIIISKILDKLPGILIIASFISFFILCFAFGSYIKPTIIMTLSIVLVLLLIFMTFYINFVEDKTIERVISKILKVYKRIFLWVTILMAKI